MFKQESQDCFNPVCKDSPLGQMRNKLSGLKPQEECPLNREELGQTSWALIHTFACYYPQSPSSEEKQVMLKWLQGFKYMYPCTHCRGHFQKDFDKDPPSLESQKDLLLWTCRQHNYVNKILGKPQYDCDYQRLLKRWKTGCDFDEY